MDSDAKPAPKFAIRTMQMDIEAARKGERAKAAVHALSDNPLLARGADASSYMEPKQQTSWRAYAPAQEQESVARKAMAAQRQVELKPAVAPISQTPLKSIPEQAPETIFTSAPTTPTPKKPATPETSTQAPTAPVSAPAFAAVATPAAPASPGTPAQKSAAEIKPPQPIAAPAMPAGLDALLSQALGGQQTQTTEKAITQNVAATEQKTPESPKKDTATAATPTKPSFLDRFTPPPAKQNAEDIVSSILAKKETAAKEKETTTEEKTLSSRQFRISAPITSEKNIDTAVQVQSVARKNLPSYLREMPKPPTPDGKVPQEIEEPPTQPKPIARENPPLERPDEKKIFQETKRESFGDTALPAMKKEAVKEEKKTAIKPEEPKEGDYFTVPKKKTLPKILLMVGGIVVVGAVGFVVYTLLFKKVITPPATTPPVQNEQKPEIPAEEKPAEEIPVTAPQDKMPALMYYNQAVDLSADTSQLKQTLTQATELETLQGPLVLLQLLQNGGHLSASEFFSAMNIPFPSAIIEKTQAFNAVLSISNIDKRIGVILKVSDAFAVDLALTKWQEDIMKGAPTEDIAVAPLFLNVPHRYADTAPAFAEVMYKNNYIKYINLPDGDTSFDYALVTDYKQNTFLIFATSQKQMSTLIDGVLSASR